MTPETVARLKELGEKVLPAPWKTVANANFNGHRLEVAEGERKGWMVFLGSTTYEECEFLALLRNHASELIEAVERAAQASEAARLERAAREEAKVEVSRLEEERDELLRVLAETEAEAGKILSELLSRRAPSVAEG